MRLFIKPFDIVVFALAVLFAVAAVLVPLLFESDGELLAVTVTENGTRKVTYYPLSENTSFDIENNGIALTVIINNGEASVESSSCPAGICKHSRSISSRGESIVCVPAEVLLTVEGGDADVGLIAG
jgi:hypothetical protein